MARASGEVLPKAAVSRGATAAIFARFSGRQTSLYIEPRLAGLPSGLMARMVPEVPSTAMARTVRPSSFSAAKAASVAFHHSIGSCQARPKSVIGATMGAVAMACSVLAASVAAMRTPEVPMSMPRTTSVMFLPWRGSTRRSARR